MADFEPLPAPWKAMVHPRARCRQICGKICRGGRAEDGLLLACQPDWRKEESTGELPVSGRHHGL